MNQPFYPDCHGCRHNSSGVIAGHCTALVPYPEGDPRGLAGYCNHKCIDDPIIKAWQEGKSQKELHELEGQLLLNELLEEIRKDPIAKQAFKEAIREGAFPRTETGFQITLDGFNWMRRREEQLRQRANPGAS